MRSNASILILVLAASAAFAQTTPATVAKTPAAPASKPTAAAAKAGVKSAPAAAPAKSATSAVAPAKARKKAAKRSAPDGTVTEPETKVTKPVTTAAGRRDPFMSPVQNRTTGTPCPSGKKCLVPGEVQLRGVIKYQYGMIALVENSQRKSYSLHENDPVLNGYVVRITLDSIVFKETTQDRLGRSSSREVVRRLTVPAV